MLAIYVTFLYNARMSEKLTHEIFLERVKDRLNDYLVLSEYQDATKKIRFKCLKCGYEFEMKPHSFMYGNGCKKCRYKALADSKKKSFEEWRAKLPSKYDDFEFSGYTGARKPIMAKCLICGHSHLHTDASHFTTGTAGCRYCSRRKPEIDPAIEVKRYGFTMVKDLGHRKVLVKCDKCGRESIRMTYNMRRSPCKYCNPRSKAENTLFFWVKEICPDAIHDCKKALGNGQELDIYVPSAKVAIEYDGDFWHSHKHLQDKNYHRDKSLLCREKGIRLIHVWEHDWMDLQKRAVIENIILGALSKLPRRTYARDCEVHSYTQKDERWKELGEFFAKNNVQGNRGGSIVYALEKDGEILMAYKFGRPSGGKAKLKYQYEMVRGASAPGVQVIGGASKLWKHFIADIDPESVVYYIDFNYFDGRSVEKLGLKYEGGHYGVKNYYPATGIVKNRDPRHHKETMKLIQEGKILEQYTAGSNVYVYRKKNLLQ